MNKLYEIMKEEYGEPPREESVGKEIVYTSFLETQEYILEQIKNTALATRANKSPASLLKYSKLTGEIECVAEFETDNKIYRPITNQLTDSKTVTLPTGVEEYEDTHRLIQDIKEYMFKYFDPPEFFDNFLPYYVLFTWVFDKFPFIAYLHFVGLTGTGKTVAAETIGSICYKPVDAAGTVTISSIFRLADQWRGTLFLDEFDLSSFGKDGYKAILTFLKTGVSDRNILRVEGEKKREIQSFAVKSPKIFTSETPITDAGLQSRTFVIKMEKTKRRLPLYKLANYQIEGEKLRNKLLLWRLRHLNNINLSEIEFGIPELEHLDRRVQQIITPIYYLGDEDARADIFNFAKRQEEETFRERRESLPGQVFQAILETGNTPSISMISEIVNKGRELKLTERKLGNVIRKELNFDIQRLGHDKISTVILKDNRVVELKEYYGLTGTYDASVASDADDAIEKAQEVFNI